MNYAQVFADWVKGQPLDYIKPEQRRALPLIVSGAADDAQLSAAGAPFVFGIKSAAQFSSRSTSAGPIERAQAGQFVIPWVLSDESSDRMGDVISADGWKLEAFKKNPVVLWGHGGGGVLDGDEPIGKATNLRVEKKRLIADLVFAVEESERAARKFKLANSGYIKAGSVGFRPVKVERVEDEEERTRLGLGRFGVLYKEQELLEFSLVAVPANPHALQQSIKAGEIDESDAEWLQRECANATERDFERIMRRKARESAPAEAESKPLDAETIARTLEHDENLRKLIELIRPKKSGDEISAEMRFVMDNVLGLRAFMKEMSEARAKEAKDSAEAMHAVATALVTLAKSNTDLSGNLGALRVSVETSSADAVRSTSRRDDEIINEIDSLLRKR